LDCLQYAHEQGCAWDEDTFSRAARGGHLNCVRYAHEQGCPWDGDTCSEAARGFMLVKAEDPLPGTKRKHSDASSSHLAVVQIGDGTGAGTGERSRLSSASSDSV
jgi:hypothetical protein